MDAIVHCAIIHEKLKMHAEVYYGGRENLWARASVLIKKINYYLKFFVNNQFL